MPISFALAAMAAPTFLADALALVRLGLAHLADAGGELADGLLVGAGDVDLREAVEGHRHVGRDVEADLVGVADRQHELLTLHLGLVADALDLEALAVAVG